ncbi:methyl-accepting chemotaxis protein [Roseateles depolymerans]|uniref:Methyl-accepting chemotaxis sensory transducer n=1 Tax=Roseateles depolymerans TaxID=76731 RepID=A0A0U3LBE7_9BURK|nr:methyl-accepting chemotaxis protein [Roseateles depolymerans]ALV08686.1 Methyl-accepting chemotaxis sensory transducer [Roseateles depolymerans]REG21087.1 methyl-accepting chemotaxis protein [Roseateles depolymerans]
MRFLRNLSIRQRLLGSTLLLCLLIIGLGAWSAISLDHLQNRSSDLLDRQSQTAQDTARILASLERIQRLEQSVMLNGNNTNEAGEHHAQWKKTVADMRAQLKSVMTTPEREQALAPALAGFEAHVKPLADILQQVVDAKMDPSAAFAYAGQAQADLDTARTVFNKWVEDTQAAVIAEREADQASSSLQSKIRLGGLVVIIALVSGLMLALVRSILTPLGRASEVAKRIARGDLTADIVVQGRDEVAAFMQTLADMQMSLREIVGQVRQSAESIRIASDEVATGNLDLSQRTEQTASNLQETAASMEELTSTVRHSAQAALQARELATSASTVADRGGQMVGQVVRTMGDINLSSRKISDITGVIDTIAFQTNILALNAAVEAARAGEQGRGFAVVASEVRGLAQRSAEAAKEIKALIGESVERVEGGSRQVVEAGDTMGELVASVRKVSDIIGEISQAADRQSQGIGEVGAAVTVLDQMTQQNAALVEQSAAAAESLKNQARQLSDVVATFRLDAELEAKPQS